MMRQNLADSLPVFLPLLSTISPLPHGTFFETLELVQGKVLKCQQEGKKSLPNIFPK